MFKDRVVEARTHAVDHICKKYLEGMKVDDIAQDTGYTPVHVRNILLMKKVPQIGDRKLRMKAFRHYDRFCSNKSVVKMTIDRDIKKVRNEIIEKRLRCHVQVDELQEKLTNLLIERQQFYR